MKKCIKLTILLLMVVVGIFTLSACNSTTIRELDNLKKQQLFEQKEDKYFVFMYREDCEGCEEVKPYIIAYATAIKENDDYKDKRPMYGFNLSLKANYQAYRKYTGENGQGTDGAYFVNGVTNWEDLYIGSTPSIISIYLKDGVKTAKYVAQGPEAIKELITTQLN